VAADAGDVLAVASGTEALEVALWLVGVRPGDAVVMPTFACRALADAVGAIGARALICDVDECYGLDAADARRALGDRRPAAVLAFHPFGRRLALEPLRSLACPVIEDCAHALLGTSEADVSIYSFQATKLLATGEGGAVVARTSATRAGLGSLRNGRNDAAFVARRFSPMSDLAASLGISQLEQLGAFAERRRILAAVYDQTLGDVIDVDRRNDGQVPFRWLARVEAPFPALRAALEARGIAIRRPVDPLLHHELGLDPGRFPTAERLYEVTISLPLYPSLSTDQARLVSEQLTDVLAGLRTT
jgi:dTDP-4-amino-4,6-dideoxygalactose transaminase